jgi:LysR family glycine cleavage system transcriptional activator
VALAKHRLAAEDIRRGRLILPFTDAVPLDFAYFMVSPRAKLNLPKVSFFRDWLREQVRLMELAAHDPSI